jgi:hypothetical protein
MNCHPSRPIARVVLAAAAAISAISCSLAGAADSRLIVTDATWRACRGTNPVTADWISNVDYDDSDAAGWVYAFKSPTGDHIWYTSNLSSDGVSHARFRYVFDLSAPVTSAVANHIAFDDNGELWINGTVIVHDTGGGATQYDDVVLDPSLFVPGENLIAMEGFDTSGPFHNVALNMTLTTVPEPSSIALLCIAALAVVGRVVLRKAPAAVR